ncbi:MAG: PA2169 family four-helix-bundle protein [Peptococcaceae bacterium]|nr:PA2169 family four-helix-bundle protein [Peptococcaceae bacterium]
MNQITAKNLTMISDLLESEALLVKKFATASENAMDPELKSKLSSMSHLHRKHYTTLLNYLNSHQ